MSDAVTLATDPAEVRAIAAQAYLYAYPMLVSYGFFHRQVVGASAPERQAVNQLTHFRTLSSPDVNNYVPWVNTDTLYSACWLDLRVEPMVLRVPAMEPHRFQDIQMNDWYTMAFVTRGTRDRGNDAATYLIAGPDWRGETPAGVDEVLRSEGWIVKAFARILLEGPGDEAAIHALQDRYQLCPLSVFLNRPAPTPVAAPAWPVPDPAGMWGKGMFEMARPDFIGYFNFLLTLVEIHPDEYALFERFARIGIRRGAAFDARALAAETARAIEAGIQDALARINRRVQRLDEPVNGWVYPLDLRGGRDVLAGSDDAFWRRAVLAKYAIWGPPAEEVVYMTAELDSRGEPLDGSGGRCYTLHFDRSPPARGFWSFTVYDANSRLLIKHPSGRYKLGDRDRGMVKDKGGALTLYLQNAAPGAQREANWLPVPDGPFQVVGRLYWPEQELLDKRYLPPPLVLGS